MKPDQVEAADAAMAARGVERGAGVFLDPPALEQARDHRRGVGAAVEDRVNRATSIPPIATSGFVFSAATRAIASSPRGSRTPLVGLAKIGPNAT